MKCSFLLIATVLFAHPFIPPTNAASVGALFNPIESALKKAMIKKIQDDAKAKEAARKKQLEEQKKNIADQTNLKALQKQAEEQAEEANRRMKLADEQFAAVEIEKTELQADKEKLAADNYALNKEKDDMTKQLQKLEVRERIFSGTFFGLLVTAILGIVTAIRSGKSVKLQNKLSELQIAKLERELRRLQSDPPQPEIGGDSPKG